jgi:hypothetical protein
VRGKTTGTSTPARRYALIVSRTSASSPTTSIHGGSRSGTDKRCGGNAEQPSVGWCCRGDGRLRGFHDRNYAAGTRRCLAGIRPRHPDPPRTASNSLHLWSQNPPSALNSRVTKPVTKPRPGTAAAKPEIRTGPVDMGAARKLGVLRAEDARARPWEITASPTAAAIPSVVPDGPSGCPDNQRSFIPNGPWYPPPGRQVSLPVHRDPTCLNSGLFSHNQATRPAVVWISVPRAHSLSC